MSTNMNRQDKKTAVALSYEKGNSAPVVVASGEGYLADKIIKTAEDAAVPVYKDVKLAKSLANIEIGEAIPPELYGAVAEILLFVTDLEKLKSKL